MVKVIFGVYHLSFVVFGLLLKLGTTHFKAPPTSIYYLFVRLLPFSSTVGTTPLKYLPRWARHHFKAPLPTSNPPSPPIPRIDVTNVSYPSYPVMCLSLKYQVFVEVYRELLYNQY